MIFLKTVKYNRVSCKRKRVGSYYIKDDFNAFRKITTYWLLFIPIYRSVEYLDVSFSK
jgi:hypothetical protein